MSVWAQCVTGGVGFVLLLEGTKVTKSWAPAAHPAWMPSCPRQPRGLCVHLVEDVLPLVALPAFCHLCARVPSTVHGRRPELTFPWTPLRSIHAYSRVMKASVVDTTSPGTCVCTCAHTLPQWSAFILSSTVFPKLPRGRRLSCFSSLLLPFPTEPLCSGSP